MACAATRRGSVRQWGGESSGVWPCAHAMTAEAAALAGQSGEGDALPSSPAVPAAAAARTGREARQGGKEAPLPPAPAQADLDASAGAASGAPAGLVCGSGVRIAGAASGASGPRTVRQVVVVASGPVQLPRVQAGSAEAASPLLPVAASASFLSAASPATAAPAAAAATAASLLRLAARAVWSPLASSASLMAVVEAVDVRVDAACAYGPRVADAASGRQCLGRQWRQLRGASGAGGCVIPP